MVVWNVCLQDVTTAVHLCCRSLPAVFPEEDGQTEANGSKRRDGCTRQTFWRKAGSGTRDNWTELGWASTPVPRATSFGAFSPALDKVSCDLHRWWSSGSPWMNPAGQNTSRRRRAAPSPASAPWGPTSALDRYRKTLTRSRKNTCRIEAGRGKASWTHTGSCLVVQITCSPSGQWWCSNKNYSMRLKNLTPLVNAVSTQECVSQVQSGSFCPLVATLRDCSQTFLCSSKIFFFRRPLCVCKRHFIPKPFVPSTHP